MDWINMDFGAHMTKSWYY